MAGVDREGMRLASIPYRRRFGARPFRRNSAELRDLESDGLKGTHMGDETIRLDRGWAEIAVQFLETYAKLKRR